MIIHNCEQGTDEWFACRAGKLTASNFHTLMGKGVTRDGILLDKAAEIVTGLTCEFSHINNKDIARGHELEPFAREAYEELKGVKVNEVGFVELDDYVGASPDGMVGDDGLIEIKCPRQKEFFNVVVNGAKKIKPIYRTQIQYQLYVIDRSWCDFTVYCEAYDNPIHVIRVLRDESAIEIIKEQIERAKTDIFELLNKYNQAMG